MKSEMLSNEIPVVAMRRREVLEVNGPRMSSGLVARGIVGLLGFYKRWISVMLPPACRFLPTCSDYATEAVQLHGARRGTWMAMRRIGRCHPRHPGGLDPVPPAPEGGAC
jgi:putative membrane protein insertion efficiency factor